jgi:tetratricopeptide (TPR) repeat protein
VRLLPLRTSLLFLALFLWAGLFVGSEHVDAGGTTDAVDARPLLKEVGLLANRFKSVPSFFIDRVPLRILKAQIRAADLDAASMTVRDISSGYDAKQLVIELGESLARRGRRKDAEAVIQTIHINACSEQERLDERTQLADQIRLAYLEHEISVGDFGGATKTQQEILSADLRPLGLSKLAVGYAKRGKAANAKQFFRDAIAASIGIQFKELPIGYADFPEESSQLHALCVVCDEQIGVDDYEGAAATLEKLVSHADSFKSHFSQIDAFYEAGLRQAKLGHRPLARRLYGWAIDLRESVKSSGADWAEGRARRLARIAKAQAALGDVSDATATLGLITGDRARGYQESADVAVARARAGDVAGATAAVLSFDFKTRKKALNGILTVQIEKGDLDGALATAEKIDDNLEQTIARLAIATVYARQSQNVFAAWTVAQIHLPGPWGLEGKRADYDFQRARSWGEIYDNPMAAGLAWSFECDRRAARLAAASMILSQSLQQRPREPYATAFAGFGPDVILAVACAHAQSGSPREALAWARQIGATEPTQGVEDWRQHEAILQRIAALLGVAEGILEREGKLETTVED